MGDERDMFARLGCKKEIRSLGDPHDPFNPYPEHDISAANRYSDDYKMTQLFKSKQSWRFRVEEEQNDLPKMTRGGRMCRRRMLIWMQTNRSK